MGTDSLKLPVYLSAVSLSLSFMCFVSLVQLYSATLVPSIVCFVCILLCARLASSGFISACRTQSSSLLLWSHSNRVIGLNQDCDKSDIFSFAIQRVEPNTE